MAELVDSLIQLRHALQATDPRAPQREVGILGRLLGNDIEWQAQAMALKERLPVVARRTRQALDALLAHRDALQAQGLQSHETINAIAPELQSHLQLISQAQRDTLIAGIDQLAARVIPLLALVPALVSQSRALATADTHARALADLAETLALSETSIHPSSEPSA